MLRTIVDIVRLRPSLPTRSARAVRPASAAARPFDAPSPALPAARSGSSRRPGPRTILVGLLLLLSVAVAAALLLTMPSIESTTPRGIVADSRPTIRVRVANPAPVPADRAELRIDGERVDARVEVLEQGGLVTLRAPQLADGDHQVEVRLRRVGVLRRTLTERWTLRIDTEAPEAVIAEPAAGAQPPSAFLPRGVVAVTELPLRIAVDAEPGSTLHLSSTREEVEAVELPPADDRRRTVELDLPQGRQGIVVVARDEAGNETRVVRRLLVDTSGPQLTLRAPRVVRDARLAVPVSGRDPHGVSLQVRLDGSLQEEALQERSTTPPPNAGAGAAPRDGIDEPATGGDDQERPEAPIAGTWQLRLAAPTYEGRHVVEVVATDAIGNRRTLTRTIVVDSGDDLRSVAGLRPGARGGDVVELHDALVAARVVGRDALAEDARSRTYGGQTRAAVQSFQSRRGMSADGVAGPDTIAALTLKVVIDRSAFTLTLYRHGEVVKRYGIAVGTAEYPTPAGEFQVQSKVVDPTWVPPDSEWAKDAKVTKPGPDNPLGTRWMAINGTIGIHGTNAPSSIGSAASHGCIRMLMPDVEELFEIVELGTPVTVI